MPIIPVPCSLGARMKQGVEQLGGPGMKLNLVEAPDRKNLVWRGGSALASASTFTGMCLTRAEYNVWGSSAVHRWCVIVFDCFWNA